MGQFSIELDSYSDGQQWELEATLQRRLDKTDEVKGSIHLGIRSLIKCWQEPLPQSDPTATSDGVMFHSAAQCQLCSDPVAASDKCWPCQQCLSVFHLTCATKLAKKVDKKGASWNCPWCASKVEGLPKASCYCGKSSKQAGTLTKGGSLPSGRGSHSCGQTCERACPLPGCESTPHGCDQTCHIGPCGHLGENLFCFCGKQKIRLACGLSPIASQQAFACPGICGKKMEGCAKERYEHSCYYKCHDQAVTPCRCPCDLSSQEADEYRIQILEDSKRLLKQMGL
jgi:hypothetical protein